MARIPVGRMKLVETTNKSTSEDFERGRGIPSAIGARAETLAKYEWWSYSTSETYRGLPSTPVLSRDSLACSYSGGPCK